MNYQEEEAADGVVRRPLSPALLEELGALTTFPKAPGDFQPGGSWINSYRIYTCHGYINRSNEDHGFLRLEREAGDTAESFTLKADQTIHYEEAAVQTIAANIRCRNDALATPVSWTIATQLFGPDGKLREALSSRVTGEVSESAWTVESGGRSLRRKVSDKTTADWCLFEAVQRMPHSDRTIIDFDLLEGLNLFKPGCRLSYSGTSTASWKGAEVPLDQFRLFGRGFLPYEIWTDSRRRLVLFTTLTRAYILDPEAPEKTRETIRLLREGAGRGTRSGKGGAKGKARKN